jgi:two-component system chemotaxis response regulator CheB
MIRVPVALVDSSTTVRAVLRRMLSARTDLMIVDEYASMDQLWERPDGIRGGVVVVGTAVDDVGVIEREAERLQLTLDADLVVLSSVIAEGVDWHPSLGTVLTKPRVPEGWETLRDELPELVSALGRRRVIQRSSADSHSAPRIDLRPPSVIVVGASTGGPQALHEFVAHLGEPLSAVPMLVVQHIAPGFERGLVEWLRRDLGVDACVAGDDEPIRRGRIHVAPSGRHLELASRHRLALDAVSPPRRGHRPSVDHLFASAAEHFREGCAAVLLSGMGRDGADGIAAVHRAGGSTFAQDEQSCSVFGMPASAISEGTVGLVAAPAGLGRALGAALRDGGTT